MPYLTNDTRDIANMAMNALTSLFKPHIRYKKCGIGLLDVRTQKYEQGDFFNRQQSEQSWQLMNVMDKVNKRYGRHTMKLGNTGIQRKWAMRREYMSPRYTTQWRDIPLVRC